MNPTDISGESAFRFPHHMEATSTQQDLTVDDRRTYTLAHTGLDASLAAITEEIIFSFSRNSTAPTVDADGSAEENKLVLANGMSVEVGPGIKVISFKTPSGSPCFSIIPGMFERDR